MLGENPVRPGVDEAADDSAGVSPGPSRGDTSRVSPETPERAARFILAPSAPPGSAWRDPVIWSVAALAFGAYFALSLFKLLQLTPSSWDLGVYTEFVKQLAQLHAPIVDARGAGYNLEGDHFQIAVGVIAPFFRLFPTPATLLFFQALFTALSVFPVATAAFSLTGRVTGRLIAFAYAFSWGLQQMNDFDFHEIALAVPLLAFSLSALVRRRPAAAIGWAMPLVFVKEDQGFTLAAIGALLMASAAFPSLLRPVQVPVPSGEGEADHRYAAMWGGMFLVGWGLFWSMFAITVIIPHFNPLHGYYYLKDGGAIGDGKPLSVSALAVQAGGGWPTKAQTLVLLLLPTVFVALGSPVALVAVPSLVLRFISPNTAYWGTAWHYNATVMPILFIAAVEAIGRWRRPPGGRMRGRVRDLVRPVQAAAVRHGGAMMATAAVVLAFQFPLSQLWQAQTYRLDAHVAAADAAMAVVPDGATVTATLDLLAPLGARTDTFWIGNSGNPATQYIVFDGDDSGFSPSITNVPDTIAHWYAGDGYVQVFSRDNVYVFRRPG